MPKSPARNATINDVARAAGVSYQTVSRVINQHASVAPGTRERVLAAIAELNYRPSLVAKGLVTRRSQLIGVVAYGTGQYGPAQIVQNVELSAREHGYETMLTTLPDFAPDQVEGAVARLRQFGVDGLVLLTPLTVPDLSRAVGPGLPCVMVDVSSATVPGVGIDQQAGAVRATEHLIALGHQRILHVGGPREWGDAELRHQGYLGALARHNLTPLPRLDGDWSAQSGFQAMQQAILDDPPRFTAVFAANDQMALGVLSALTAAGLRVPDDMSVVGFDDTPEAAYFQPPLTTVRQDFAQVGRRSIDELMRQIHTPDAKPRPVVLEPELIVRATTGKPR